MEKKMFWSLSDNVELSKLYLRDLDEVKSFIDVDIQEILQEDKEEHQYTLTPVFFTEEEFDKLPEYQF